MDRVAQPIIKGVTSGTEHDSVVVLTTFQAGKRMALCTATLVAPNLIVTARHCVSNTDGATACAQDGSPVTGGGISGTRVASSLVVFAGKNGQAPDTNVEANGVAHGKRVIVDSSTNVCNHDMAFVVLDKDVAAPVSPIRMAAPSPSETISAVGWGVDETGNLPTHREVRSGLGLVGVGPAPYPGNPAWGYGDREFMTGEAACAGDSGGPAFAQSGAIVGIAARTGNGKPSDGNYATTCLGSDAHSVYTHFGKFEGLVNASFKEAGHTIWLEGQPDPYATIQSTSSGGAGGTSGAVGNGATDGPSAGGDPKKPGAKDAPSGDPVGGGTEPGAPGGRRRGDNGGGGCSMSSGETLHDNVAHAAGLVALVALVLGLRRRFKQGDAVVADEPPPPREPYESML
ncbi:MAG: trypsin-like serine protease [Labilithrix sp.]